MKPKVRRGFQKADSMIVRTTTVALIGALMVLPTGPVWADAAAAQTCAATLPKDGQAIFRATLPQVQPGTDLRDVVTASTRSLVEAGQIDRGTARQSAVAAAQCLRLAGP
jgi:hypothetical protein